MSSSDAHDTQSRHHLGVDIGGTRTKWALVEDDGTTVSVGMLDTPRTGHADVLGTVVSLAREIGTPVATVGVALPGTVDVRAGQTLTVPNLPGSWSDLPVADLLADELGTTVTILNDARASARAELATGAARGAGRALFVVLGTGVGGALVLDGELLSADVDAVGEIGHLVVDPGGPRCGCGERGCLETFASATAVTEHVAAAYREGGDTILAAVVGDGPLTALAVARAARAGCQRSAEAYDRASRALAQAISSVVTLLRLELVVVGGGLAGASDLLLPHTVETLAGRRHLVGTVEVRTAHHTGYAGALGAAFHAARTATTGRTRP